MNLVRIGINFFTPVHHLICPNTRSTQPRMHPCMHPGDRIHVHMRVGMALCGVCGSVCGCADVWVEFG